MTITWLEVRPCDTIMIRDGRPFDIGAGSVARGVVPQPHTLGGVARAALGREVDRIVGPYVRVGDGARADVDYATCASSGPNSPGPTPIGTWVRYTATYDGTTLRCYRDGVFVSMARLAGSLVPAGDQLIVGRNYPGDIDAVRLFGRALDAAAIAAGWP